MSLTQSRLLEVIKYNPETGEFSNLVNRGSRGIAGARAGSRQVHGYIEIGVDGVSYLAHRLAFLYMTGEWPKNHVDHIDGNPSNTRWDNLRDVPRKVNMQNRRKASAVSSTGLLGAYKNGNRFKSSIRVNGRLKHIGHFDTAEAAHAAYIAAKRNHHEGNTL